MINKIRNIIKRKPEKGESQNDSEEKGIALLMTLGMLAMILVIGLGFATSATMNAKSTSIAADKTNAEFLVQSAIARIAYLANNGHKEIVSHGFTYNKSVFEQDPNLMIYYSPQDWIYQLHYAKGREMHKPYDLISGSTGTMIYNDVTWEYITGPYKNKHDGYESAAGRSRKGENKHDPKYTNDYDPTDPGIFNSKIDEENTEEIYGRMAYWLVPSTGLDPAALVSDDVDEYKAKEIRVGARVSEINIGSLDDENNKNRNFKKAILEWKNHSAASGESPVNIGQFNYSSQGGNLQTTWENSSHLPDPMIPGYQDYLPYPYGYGWETSTKNPSIFTELLDGSNKITDLDEEHARKWFSEKPEPTQEKYWLDINLDGEADSDTEIFHRFNLARNWDGLDVVDIVGKDDDNTYYTETNTDEGTVRIYHPPTTYPKDLNDPEDTTLDDGEVIPWIANWTEPGTFYNARTRAKQIAANLIDYCDTDDQPSSDVDPTTWGSANGETPLYTGNELTYYINEIHADTSISKSHTSLLGKTLNSYTVELNVYVESVNIYPDSASKDFDIYFDGNFSYKYTEGDGNVATRTEAYTQQQLTLSDDVDPYLIHTCKLDVDVAGDFKSGTAQANVSDVKFSITRIWMKENNTSTPTCYDYVAFVNRDDAGNITGTNPKAKTIASPDTNAEFNLQVSDPRQNLNFDDWPEMTTSTDPYTPSSSFHTIKANNSNCDPSFASDNDTRAIKDKETNTKIVDSGNYLSTAFIRNAPMVSPWELGAISRGAQWETINLHEYNKYDGNAKEGGSLGGGLYTDEVDASTDNLEKNGGDANILDQIKMDSLIQTPMKVSFNCDDTSDIFYALVYNIQYGDYYGDYYIDGSNKLQYTGSGTNPIEGDTAAKIAELLSEKDIQNRAEVASITELTDGSLTGSSSNITDAEQEELIGKFINLTSTSSTGGATSTEVKRAVILVQVIHDFGGTVDDDGNRVEEKIFRDIDGDGDFDGNVKETGLDLDGLNYMFDGGSYFKLRNGKYTITTSDLVGEYKNNYEDYKNDTLIASPVQMDPDPDFSSNKEHIFATKGRYDKYADEIAYEMKVLVELKWDATWGAGKGKYKVLRYEVIGE